jgi:hypothetical protein
MKNELSDNQEQAISAIMSSADHKINTSCVANVMHLPVVSTYSVLLSLNKKKLVYRRSNQHTRHITWELNERKISEMF